MAKQKGKISTDRKNKVDKTKRPALSLRNIEFLTNEELLAIPTRDIFIFDTECYPNFWCCAFKHIKSDKFLIFERSPDKNFDDMQLRWMLWRFCVVGFNSKNYDIPMIELAMSGKNCAELKEASDFIIKSGPQYGTKKVTSFDVSNQYGIKIGNYNHIDLFNVCPVNGGNSAKPASLKLYAGRLHAEKLQDLPIDPDELLTREDAEILRLYCCNDLDSTEIVFKKLLPEIQLRVEMTEQYGVDLRSKSDAQIAEAVIKSELEKVLGYEPKGPEKVQFSVRYKKPNFISFSSEQLNKVLSTIENCEFFLDDNGSPIMPKELSELSVKIGDSEYNLGMGGLHSKEQKIFHIAENGIIIADNDVESFYPRTILNQGLFPEHLGEAFLKAYEKIVVTRIEAKKKAKDFKKIGDKKQAKYFKTIADSLKIVINGLFGKFGNKYSIVYAPQLMLQVTITGQLVLLMLIEEFERRGIKVISGNTDGFVSMYHESRHEEVRNVIDLWEKHTCYKTEETRYWLYAARDVNNYVAGKLKYDEVSAKWIKDFDEKAEYLDEQLGMKTKGVFSERGSALNSILSKNPESLICTDALLKFLRYGNSIEKTILECKDVKRFVSVKNVAGGAHKNGVYLGKVARWYYGKNATGSLNYAARSAKVANSEGAIPLMELPENLPMDIDYEKYIEKSIDMLYDCGRFKASATKSLFSAQFQ